ncbi:MAG: peptidylprolyl isomerase [Gammaproteobacteria bacterium]|nr:peptidylprolyl isomerase [Gammaproteobacteria bacterium]
MKLLLSALFSLSVVSGAFAAQPLDQTIAIVEQDVILESELKRQMASVVRQLKERNQPLPEMSILQEQVLERMIITSLQLQMAKRAGVRISDQELNATISDIAKDNNQTLEQLRQSITDEGVNWELFREDLRSEIMVARVRRGQVSRRISISEREVDNLVKLIDNEGAQNIQYHLGHILIPIDDISDQQSIQTAREKAQDLVKQLRSGANFATLAINHSKGQEALSGGDFGWRSGTQLPTLFAAPAKNLAIGEVSDPLRSGSGFHIIKLIEKKGDVQHIVKQVNARHILLSPNTIRPPQETKAFAQTLYQQLKDGADFSELAKEHSDDKGTAREGGELGWSTPDTYVGPFRKAVETLPTNQLSEPVETQFGWHIIEVLGRRDADQTREFKRERAARILQSRKFDEEVEAWIRELRDSSYVEVLIDDSSKK